MKRQAQLEAATKSHDPASSRDYNLIGIRNRLFALIMALLSFMLALAQQGPALAQLKLQLNPS